MAEGDKQITKGRGKAIGQDELSGLFRKLEPFLRAGLSIYKACLEAKVPKSAVYEHIKTDEKFAEDIKRAQQFLSVLTAQTMMKQFHEIVSKQQAKQNLTKEELGFLKWFAINSNVTREEFGKRQDIGLYDPEAEIQRITTLIDEAAKKKKDEPAK